jgi:hypothetical protein
VWSRCWLRQPFGENPGAYKRTRREQRTGGLSGRFRALPDYASA